MIDELNILFYGLVFIIAFMYSTVGHGGASGFLALMALFSFTPELMKFTALTMNLFVSGTAYAINHRMGNFKFRLLIPFIIASIPMVFLGARMPIDPKVYKMVLGIFLLLVGLRFLLLKPGSFDTAKMPKWWILTIVGAVLGFVSGMLGIGGGVILSPIMLLFHWAKLKEVSATVAAFIFLNSASGLLGLFSTGYKASPDIWVLVAIAIAGALMGSYSSVQKFSTKTIQYILTVVLLWAGVKLSILS